MLTHSADLSGRFWQVIPYLFLDIQGVPKKGNRALECPSTPNIQSTARILSQSERRGF